MLSAFECAETAADPQMRDQLLTFVMIGGGPTGVEMAGALAELAKATLARDFVYIDPTSSHPAHRGGSSAFSGFPEEQSAYPEQALRRLGVEVLTNASVDDIDAIGMRVQGRRIEAAAVIWCAGMRATPVAEWTGAQTGRGGTVKVLPDLSLPGRPEVLVVGDAALVSDAHGGGRCRGSPWWRSRRGAMQPR